MQRPAPQLFGTQKEGPMNNRRFLIWISLAIAVVSLVCGFGQGRALAQATNVPTCNGTNGPNCTDYFGVGNWANSPLPSSPITSLTLIAGGSGYTNPVVVIADSTGSGASATATATAGVITLVTGSGGTGYTMPQVTIVDVGVGGSLAAPQCGGAAQPACGTGAMATAVLGGPYTGGILKFKDPLIDLKTLIAVPDTTTFPGSDYYEIGLTQYTQKMHSSLPATTLRGYVQLNKGTDPTGQNTVLPPAQSYLGPVIVAQKNRPVRVLFKNMLPTGAGGNLFIPVDTTYMGAGMGPDGTPYTENRATLHLHGGATPWISDGTPHQWTVPAGEAATLKTGASVAYVPDMWFDRRGGSPACSRPSPPAARTDRGAVPAGATNNPGPGSLTFFWTNQQGGTVDVLPRPRLRPYPPQCLRRRGCRLPACTTQRKKTRLRLRPFPEP